MLAALGFETMDQLIDATVPKSVRDTEPLRLTDLPGPMAEHELLDHLRELAGRNRVVTSMIGQGYYGTHTPAVIQRNVLENPAWYTAYTPYQPEISPGAPGDAAQLPDRGAGPDRPWTSPVRRCSTRPPRPPRRSPCAVASRRARPPGFSSTFAATRR
jgi:hypothetical protein